MTWFVYIGRAGITGLNGNHDAWGRYAKEVAASWRGREAALHTACTAKYGASPLGPLSSRGPAEEAFPRDPPESDRAAVDRAIEAVATRGAKGARGGVCQ
jgi:hypothetical protein